MKNERKNISIENQGSVSQVPKKHLRMYNALALKKKIPKLEVYVTDSKC